MVDPPEGFITFFVSRSNILVPKIEFCPIIFGRDAVKVVYEYRHRRPHDVNRASGNFLTTVNTGLKPSDTHTQGHTHKLSRPFTHIPGADP